MTTDADGQYNPAEMEHVLGPVVAGEADFVTGSRKLGSQETKDLVRRLGTWVFAQTITVLTGEHITDSSFGLRAMRAEVTGVVRLEQPQYQSAELYDRGARPRIPGRRSARHDPQAPGRREQEGPQRDLRPQVRPRGRGHRVVGAAAPHAWPAPRAGPAPRSRPPATRPR